jgi:molybdate/tungstate transport system substrate-binding protein
MCKTARQSFFCVPGLLVFLAAGPASAQSGCVSPSTQQVIVWHAGSLTSAFQTIEAAFICQTGIQVSDNSAGSLDLIRQVTAGGRAADVIAPADFLDIDLFLKPAGYADYDIRFAEGKMVLAYLESDVVTAKGYTIADSTPFNPPTSVPNAVADWYNILLKSNITIAGTHLYLDPSGYRAPMIFRLAQDYYNVPNLYDNLLDHYVAVPAAGAPSGTFALGKNYDFQLIYEHSALAMAQTNADYRYVNLPDKIGLGDSTQNGYYRRAVIVVPDLFGTGFVPIPGKKVIWGITVLKTAPNPDNAIRFLQYVLGTTGQDAFKTAGPTPLIPAEVTRQDFEKVPSSLLPYVVVAPQ